MALNLGSMISAARSQRNPAGEFISNFQNQGLLGTLLGKGQDTLAPNTDQQTEQQAQPIQQSGGLGDIVQLALESLLKGG